MKVITCNANGIRAAQRKGFFDWLAGQDADVVCLQEIRAKRHQLGRELFYPEGYHCYYNDAERPGYAGTGLYARVEPRGLVTRLGWEPADCEGRWLQADFERLSVVSLYMPSGSSGEAAQEKKYAFMERLYGHLQSLRRKRREFVICADWNICHQEIDLRNWRANQKNSGFLPEERAWMSRVLDELGYIDSFRAVDRREGQYTWWSNRGRARENNVGWRLDYQLVTPGLGGRILAAGIYKERWFSDHAPHTMAFDWELAS